MAFKKNDPRINRAGRPSGAINRSNKDMRQMLTKFVESGFSKVQKDWMELSPQQRCRLWVDLLNYSLPKLQNTTLSNDLDKLSSEQIEIITNELLKKLQ